MKELAKSITSLGILWFMYKILSIDFAVVIAIGWLIVPIGLFVIYEIFDN